MSLDVIEPWIELILGIGAAALTIAFTRWQQRADNRKIYAIYLFVAALIYVGFALLSQNLAWLRIEGMGAVGFGLIAWAGAQFSSWLLVIGWLVHPVWDMALHSRNITPFVPAWYPIACAGYDVAIALYLALQNFSL